MSTIINGGVSMQYQWPAKFNFITKKITVKKADNKGFYIRGYASVSEIVDRQDEIVSSEALKGAVQGLMSEGDTLFFNHNYDQPIGRIVKAVVDKKGLFIEAFISETRPDIRKQVEEGILKRFSIGGEVLEAVSERNEELGREIIRITKMSLYEVSLVGVPANPKAEVIDYVIKCALKDVKKNKPEELKVDNEKIKNKVVETAEEKSIREALENQVRLEEEENKAIEEAEKEVVEPVEEVVEAEEKTEEEKIIEEKEELEEEKVDDEEVEDIKEVAEEEEKTEEAVESEEKEEDEKSEKSIKQNPEDMIEKTTEKDVSLAKSISDKVDAIHKAVLMNSKPVVTLWDSDVKEIIPDFEKLAVGTEIKLKVIATVSEKAEMSNDNVEGAETYKYLSFKVSEVSEYGKRNEVAVEKAEEPVKEVKVEKEVKEPSSRKGVIQERVDTTESSLMKKLSGKSPCEIMDDSSLWNSLDESMKSEVKKAYKTGMISL